MNALETKGSILWGNPVGKDYYLSIHGCLHKRQWSPEGNSITASGTEEGFGKHLPNECAQWRLTTPQTSPPLLPAWAPRRSTQIVSNALFDDKYSISASFFTSWGKGVSQNPLRGKTAFLLRKIKVTHKTICIISGIHMPSLEVYNSQVTNPYTRLWQIKTWINVKILTNQVYLLGKNKNKGARQTWVLIQVLSFASCVRLEKSSCLSQPQFPPL